MSRMRRQQRRRKKVAIIVLSIVLIGVIWFSLELYKLQKEHKEAGNLTYNQVDFSQLVDGIYNGHYDGGMYEWRVNDVQVTVKSGLISDIQLLYSSDPGTPNTDYELLFDRVMEAQSLDVDTITSASLTSKAYLKAIEDALAKAQE